MENIANLIVSELEHLNLPISKLRGHAYDGAAYKSCKCNCVNTIIMTRHSLALYTHCGAHRTNVIAQSLYNNINIRKALRVGLLYEQTIKFTKKSKTLKPISPIRWTAKMMY